MKTNFLLLFILAIFFEVIGQAPQKMSFQAVVRRSDNSLVSNAPVGCRISITQGVSGSIIYYSEYHSAMTNDNCLLSLEIGNGAKLTGAFDLIPWQMGEIYLTTEYDPDGGTIFTLSNTSQLLSVPFAFYSMQTSSTFKHYIGELYGGGMVFYVSKGDNGVEHGLIVDLSDLTTGIEWSNLYEIEVGDDAKSLWNGMPNSLAILNQSGHINSAALLCLNSLNNGYDDWYLPSIDELNLLFNARYEINKTIEIKNINTGLLNHFDYYWSSTEAKNYSAWCKHFATGDCHTNGKFAEYAVRAIRKF